jgi:hypothetical protein
LDDPEYHLTKAILHCARDDFHSPAESQTSRGITHSCD